jgi:hypothetical protein
MDFCLAKAQSVLAAAAQDKSSFHFYFSLFKVGKLFIK